MKDGEEMYKFGGGIFDGLYRLMEFDEPICIFPVYTNKREYHVYRADPEFKRLWFVDVCDNLHEARRHATNERQG